ncbi:MAG: capsular polysaccharide export protein, LipB/KpsS family, partial [Planctomycetota bacterium]
LDEALDKEVKAFIERTTSAPKLIVPHKDRTYFKDATLFNLLTPSTFKKLLRILHRKAVVNKFDETFSTRKLIVRYLKSLVRRKLLTRYYNPLPPEPTPFIYFPLHMPFDMQILVRAPQFFRQESVVEMTSRALPQGVKLFIKEHPVSIGWYPYPIMRDLARLPNVVLLHPSVSSHDVIRKARAILTINSKVGFESLAYYKPVITLGPSFYRGHGATMDVTDLSKLSEVIVAALKGEPDRGAIHGLLAAVHSRCQPGELYDPDPENVRRFSDALWGELGALGVTLPGS